MTDRNFANGLSEEELKKVIALIDPKLVTVKLTDELLFITNAKGEKIRVDARNHPDKKEIYLFAPTWDSYFKKGMEINHLILHEFLGLAGIADDGYSVSTQYFSATKRPILFQATSLRCFSDSKMVYWDGSRYVFWQSTHIENPLTATFSPPVPKKVEASFICKEGESCPEMDLVPHLKSAKLTAKFDIDKRPFESAGASTTEMPEYSMDVWVDLESESFTPGWAGARHKLSYLAPRAYVRAQMVAKTSPTANEEVWAIARTELYESNSIGQTSFYMTLINSKIFSALAAEDIDLVLPDNHRTGQSQLGAEVLIDLLAKHAIEKGKVPEGTDWDPYIHDTLFKDFPGAFPLSTYIECTAYDEAP